MSAVQIIKKITRLKRTALIIRKKLVNSEPPPPTASSVDSSDITTVPGSDPNEETVVEHYTFLVEHKKHQIASYFRSKDLENKKTSDNLVR